MAGLESVLDSDEEYVPPKNPGLKLNVAKALGPAGTASNGGKENKTAPSLFSQFKFRALPGLNRPGTGAAIGSGMKPGAGTNPTNEQELRAVKAASGPSHMDTSVILDSDDEEEAVKFVRTKRKRRQPNFGYDEDEDTPKRPHTKKTPSPVPSEVIDIDGDDASCQPSTSKQLEIDSQVIDEDVVEDIVEEIEQQATQEVDEEDVLQRCEKVAEQLRQQLGQQSTDDRYAATESSVELLTQKDLAGACGKMAFRLKPYQLVGINFLMLHHKIKTEGVILADEMGLGKTAQSICFLGALRTCERVSGPHLIIVPPSLLDNWLRELATWCPALRVVTYYGAKRKFVRGKLNEWRHAKASGGPLPDIDVDTLNDAVEVVDEPLGSSDEEEDQSDADSGLEEEEPWRKRAALEASTSGDGSVDGTPDVIAAPFDVMISCYTLFERDSTDQQIDRAFLMKWPWSYLLVDEAHALKNKNSRRTYQLRKVAQLCKHRIMLTGTPLQNDLGELSNLMQFLLPRVFKNEGVEDLEQADDVIKEQLAARMRSLLGPFLLRRLKSEVAGQLTGKVQVVQQVDMVDAQARLYNNAITDLWEEVDRSTKQKSKARSNGNKVSCLGQRRIKHLFTHLRKIAQHPLLVRSLFDNETVEKMAKMAHSRGVYGGTASVQRVLEEMMSYNDHQLNNFAHAQGTAFSGYRLDSNKYMQSGKCKVLAELLPELQRKGSRPLIFSQWTSVLDILEEVLAQMGMSYARLDGSTAVEDRILLVDRFNDPGNGLFAFLLSTRAGGQGLNLTGADTVILHDVDFNPQIDRQAEDRCHRIGQTKQVTVYRLITKETVDENIHAISQKKLDLDAAVLDGITAGTTEKQQNAAESKLMATVLHELMTSKVERTTTAIDLS